MARYSKEQILDLAHKTLERLNRDESILFTSYLDSIGHRGNNLQLKEDIFKIFREYQLAKNTQVNYGGLHILESGKLVANEIGGLKQFIYNQNNPIIDDKKLKIDFVNYLVKNEQENKISKITNYSKFRNIENERVELCADFLIKKNILKSEDNGLTLKPREPAFRIVKKPLDFDLIIQTAKRSQDSSKLSEDATGGNINGPSAAPIQKQENPNTKTSNSPTKEIQRGIFIIGVIGLILTIIKMCSN